MKTNALSANLANLANLANSASLPVTPNVPGLPAVAVIYRNSIVPLALSANRARELAEAAARHASIAQNRRETRRLLRLARRMEVAALIREWSGQEDRAARLYVGSRKLYCAVAAAHVA